MPKGVKVEIYNDSGIIETKLTSNYAIRKIKENKMVAKNDVVVVNSKGEKLNTELLTWDGAKEELKQTLLLKSPQAIRLFMEQD